MSTYRLVRSVDADEALRVITGRMLVEHWGGKLESKLEKLRVDSGSYLLLRCIETVHAAQDSADAGCSTKHVLGHARLETASFKICSPADPSVGADAMITSVIVLKESRGTGIGTILMNMLLEEAKTLNYGYVYLWTSDAQPFYSKLGFRHCPRKHFANKVVRTLNIGGDFLNQLGRVVIKQKIHNAGETEKNNTGGESWMRKRIMGQRAKTLLSASKVLETILSAISDIQSSKIGAAMVPAPEQDSIRSHILLFGFPWTTDSLESESFAVPWAGQIGPSCGVASLRIAAMLLFQESACVTSHLGVLKANAHVYSKLSLESGYYCENTGIISSMDETLSERSEELLDFLLSSGRSSDGELYDIEDLLWLVEEYFPPEVGLKASIRSFSNDFVKEDDNINFEDIFEMLLQQNCISGITSRERSIIIIPYDRDGARHGPGLHGGHHAHYAVVVGAARCGINVSSTTSDTVMSHHIAENATEYLICLQGLSCRPIVAEHSSWVQSNSQLYEREAMNEESVIDSIPSQLHGLSQEKIESSYVKADKPKINLREKCLLLSRSIAPPSEIMKI